MRSIALSKPDSTVISTVISTAWLLAALLAAPGCKKETPAAAAPATTPTASSAPKAPEKPALNAGAPRKISGESDATNLSTSSADDPFRDFNWSAVSKDGTAVLMQTHVGDGRCKRTCNDAPDGHEVWSAEGCIGKRIDLRFVANDCAKVVVLHQLPDVKSGQRWQEVDVAHVYAQAKQSYAVAAAGAVRNWKKIRSAGNTFYWLAGALSVPGPTPKYSDDGNAVQFETVDGRAQSIPLAGK